MILAQTIHSNACKGGTMMTRRDATAAVRALPPARIAGGMPFIEAVRLRRSARDFADRPLPDQVLSDLLWAAFGINRPDGGRTVPYAMHVVAIDIYLAMADGVWL